MILITNENFPIEYLEEPNNNNQLSNIRYDNHGVSVLYSLVSHYLDVEPDDVLLTSIF